MFVPMAKICISIYTEHVFMSHKDASSRDLNVYESSLTGNSDLLFMQIKSGKENSSRQDLQIFPD